MANTSYAPAVQNSPYGLSATNPYGSPYAAAYSLAENYNLKLPVDPVIFDAEPQQFMDLQILMAFATEAIPGDEILFSEKVWGRVPLTARAGVASPGTANTEQVVPITDASVKYVGVTSQVRYPNGQTGIVQSVVTTSGAATMTVLPLTGETLPAVTTGDVFVNGWEAGADGQEAFYQYHRMEQIWRSNVVEQIGPYVVRWDRREREKWRSLEQTDFMRKQIEDVRHQLKVSLCQRIWFGNYGQGSFPNGSTLKTTRGIIPWIDAAGGAALTATAANVNDVVMEAVFATDFMARNSTRMAFGTPETLYKFGLNDKRERTRYAPNETMQNYNLYEYDYFGAKIVPVPVQIWNDPASFPAEFANRIVVIDPSLVKLVYQNGIPMIEEGLMTQSRTNVTPGSIYDYELYYCQGNVGVKANNMASAFYVDIVE